MTRGRIRAQIQGQVLIYILTILVVALLVFFGYRFIRTLLQQGCDAQEINLKTEIENAMQSYIAKHSVNAQEFDAPCSYRELCVVDAATVVSGPVPSAFPDPALGAGRYALLRASVESQVKRNVFLLDDKGGLSSRTIFVDNARVGAPERILCVNATNGRFHLRFLGLGRESEVQNGLAGP